MPDPGMANLPQVAPGQAQYEAMVRAAGQDTANRWKLDEAAKLMRSGKFTPNDINSYFGDGAITPSPAAHQAAVANTGRAVQQNDGDNSFLADPARASLTAIGFDPKGVDWFLNATRAEQARQDQGFAASAGHFDKAFGEGVPQDDLLHAGLDIGRGALEFAGAGFGHAISAATGPFNEGVAAPLANAANQFRASTTDLQGQVDNMHERIFGWKATATAAENRKEGVDPHDITDGVVGILGLSGGAHVAQTAKVPEQARALAVDGLRDGTLKEPSDVLKAGGHEPTPALAAQMPSSADFATAVEQIGGAKVWGDPIAKTGLTTTGQRVLKNLQDVWVNTGRAPADVVAQVKADPAFGDELIHQDMFGEPSTPLFNATAPKQPPVAPPKAREPLAVAQGPLAQAASERPAMSTGPAGPTFVNSIDKSMEIMRQLEGSADNATSQAGARGRYQIMPGTARQYGFDPARLMDPQYNAMVARTIISKLYERFHGNMEAMSIAYNDGPGRAQQWLNRGAGTRLEAVPDRTVRSGWRYEKVAADRDESFMPMETQEYVARARAKMNGKEPEPLKEPGEEAYQPKESPEERQAAVQKEMEQAQAQVEASVAQAEQESREAGERVAADEGSVQSGSLSAANPYETMDAADRVAETLRIVGEEPKEGLFGKAGTLKQWVDERLNRWVSALTPARRVDDALIHSGAMNRRTDFGAEDAFRQTPASDDRAMHALTQGNITGDFTKGRVEIDNEGSTLPKVLEAIRQGGGDTDGFMAMLLNKRTYERSGLRELRDATAADAKAQQALGEKPNKLALKRSQEAAKRLQQAKMAAENAPSTGISPLLAEAHVNDAAEMAKYKDALGLWDELRQKVLNYYQGAQMLNAERRAAMVGIDPDYVTFRRLMGDEGPFVNPNKFSLGQVVKAFQGSDRQIFNPILATVDNFRAMFAMADRNLARLHVRDLLSANPEVAAQFGFHRVRQEVDVFGDAIDKALLESGVPEGQLEAARDALGSTVAARIERNLPDKHFFIWEDGKPVEYAVNDPFFAKLFRNATSQEEVSTIVKAGSAVAKFERGLIVANPEFAARIVGLWHPMNVWLFDRTVGAFPLHTLFEGLFDFLGKSEIYQQAKVHGAFADYVDQINERWLKTNMLDTADKAGAWDGMRNLVSNPSEFKQALQDSALSPVRWAQWGRDLMSNLSEVQRLGYYKIALKKGLDPAKAATAARKAYIDFQERGSANLANQTAQLNNFFRPHLLGMKQSWEAFADDGGGRMASARQTLTRMLIGVNATAGGLQAMAMAQDHFLPENERYTNLPQWQKDTMFITPQLPWGGRLMLKYPAGVAPIMMLQQRLLEGAFSGAFGDDGSKARWGDQQFWLDFAQSFVPPVIPSAAEPLFDIATNRVWSSGRPLASDATKSRLPADRYTYNTTEPARALGRVLAPLTPGALQDLTTPVAIEHLVSGYTGSLGMAGLKAVDGVWHAQHGTGRPLDMGDIPVVNWFVHTNPGFDGHHIDDFYASYGDFQQQKASFSFLRKTARGGSEVDLGAVDPEQVQAASALGRIAGALTMDRSIAYGVENNTKMLPNEKSQALKALYAHAVVMAEYGTAFMDTVRDRHMDPNAKEQFIDQLQAKLQPRLQELQRQFPDGGG